MNDPFFASIVKLFYDNITYVIYDEDEKKQFVSLKIYRPYEEKDGYVKLSGFRVVIECSAVNAYIRIYEMALGSSSMASMFENITDEPVEVAYLTGSKEYKILQKMILDLDKAKEKEKEEYSEAIKQEFIKGELTFDNPMKSYVNAINKDKTSSFQRQPKILSFDEDEDIDNDPEQGF